MNTEHPHDRLAFRSQLLPLFFLTAIFFLNFTVRIIISPLLPTVTEDMNLSRDQAGSFFLITASGYFVALLCSGFVSSRLLHKKTIVLSALGSGMALIAAGLSPTLTFMRLSFFAAGMASALYMPSGIALLTASLSPKNWGKGIGIHELAPNLSFLLAPVLCEALLLWISWRNVLITVGLATIILGLGFHRFAGIADFRGESPRLKSFLPLMATPSFWLMITLFSVGVTGTLGVYSMLPLYLVKEHGLVQAETNTLITLSRMFTLPMPFAVGWLSDRFGLKPTLMAVLMITGMATLLTGILTGAMIKAAIFIQAMSAVSFFPPAFAALSRIGTREARNIAVSFTIPIAFLVGGGVIPILIGLAGEKDLFSLGFIFAGGLILLGSILPLLLKFRSDP